MCFPLTIPFLRLARFEKLDRNTKKSIQTIQNVSIAIDNRMYSRAIRIVGRTIFHDHQLHIIKLGRSHLHARRRSRTGHGHVATRRHDQGRRPTRSARAARRERASSFIPVCLSVCLSEGVSIPSLTSLLFASSPTPAGGTTTHDVEQERSQSVLEGSNPKQSKQRASSRKSFTVEA